ncbi:hypothetical protein C0989_008200 [Termitomyces sp. Mn162]|nr:hypothetical protein C0989_008200 [Termitomyces sp. Mn162]
MAIEDHILHSEKSVLVLGEKIIDSKHNDVESVEFKDAESEEYKVLEDEREIATRVISVEDDPSLNPWTIRAFVIGIGLSAFGGVLGKGILPLASMLDTFFKDAAGIKKKFRIFWIVFGVIFIWELFPEWMFPLLTGFSVFCLANQRSQDFTRIFGGSNGNEGLGWVVQLLTTNLGLGATFTHLLLWNRHDMRNAWTWMAPSELKRMLKNFDIRFWKDEGKRDQADFDEDIDPHYREMLKYPDAPNSWYLVCLIVSIIMALVIIYKTDSTLPWWGFIIALLLAVLSILFFGTLYAITGLQFIIQPFVQMIGGFIHPGKPMANMYFVLFSYNSVNQALLLSRDLKIAQYTKLPPRAAFTAQIIGTLFGAVLNYVLMNSIIDNQRPILLSVEGTNIWSGQQPQQYNSQAIAWGGLSHELFAVGQRYQFVAWAYVIGLFVPISRHDSDWEDIEDIENQPRPLGADSSGSVRIGISSPQRRRFVHRTTYIASPARKQHSVPSTPSKSRKAPRRALAREEVIDGAVQGASFTFRYFFDIFLTAVRLLRRPLGLLLFLWLLAFVIGWVSHTLRGTFAPLCLLPGLYGSRFCEAPSPPPVPGVPGPPRWADYPKLIDAQSTTFEHLLDGSVGGSGLSLEIKKAEMATSDLVTLVRVSNLKARNTLGDQLSEFVDDAKKTGRDLQRLSSKIGGAVDK